MKHAEISPLFKTKNDLIKANYRPLNILIAFTKVFETINAQFIDFFKDICNDMLYA